MPQASIVIPAYNAEGTLAATVASAQNQTFADIEILIVDDASSDATAALARRLAAADPRVRLIEAGHNRGPAGARHRHAHAGGQGPHLALRHGSAHRDERHDPPGGARG